LIPCPLPTSFQLISARSLAPPPPGKIRKFYDLAAKPNMPADEIARQRNGHAAPSWELVKVWPKELEIDEAFLEKLADQVRRDLA
jgi:hypothetical protein